MSHLSDLPDLERLLGMNDSSSPTAPITSIYHADHSITRETLEWALSELRPTGFFLHTLTLPEGHSDLLNALYGPSSGDPPVAEESVHYAPRSADRPPSRMVRLPARPTRLLTIIGMVSPDGVVIYTAYGGPAAEREPGDPTLTPGSPEHAAAAVFWASHALASG